MSFIIIKDKATAKKIKEISLDTKPYLESNTLYMNSADKCLVCSGERNFNDDNNMYEPLVGHHVKYFPAVVAWVHYDCHKKIHDGKRPDLIQYENGDSTKYYRMKHERLEGKNGFGDGDMGVGF